MLKMRDIFTVTKFTATDMVKRKSFIISTIIILAMIVVGFNIPKIIKSFNKGTEKIIIVDKDNVFENKITPVEKNTEIILENQSVEEIKEKIKNKEIEYGIIIDKKDNTINLTYVLENKMSSGPSEEFISSLKEITFLYLLHLGVFFEQISLKVIGSGRLRTYFSQKILSF